MVYYLLVAIFHHPSNFIVVICPRFDLWGLLGSGSWVQPKTLALVAGDSGLDTKSPVSAGDFGLSPPETPARSALSALVTT
jgi:hypothetical protein